MPGVELNHFIAMLLNMNKQKLGKKKKTPYAHNS